MFFNGLMINDLDSSINNIDDEMDQSISLKCSEALAFLSLIVGDPLLDMSYQYVSQLLEHSQSSGQQTWVTNFIGLLALNSTIEGMSVNKICLTMDPIMQWIYENTQNESLKVQSCAASLLGHIAQHGPDVLFKDEQSLTNFYNWFKSTIERNSHPRIVMHAMRALQNFYISLDGRQ